MDLSFEIHYKNGVENIVADALSRINEQPSEADVPHCLVITQLQPKWFDEVMASYEADQEVMQVITLLSSNPSALVDDTLQQGILRHKGKIWVGKHGTLRQQLISTIHYSGLGGHSGVTSTYQRLKAVFYWPAMIEDVKKIIQECEVCQRCKDEQVAYPGLLQPLPVPERAWEHISMDFIESFPKSEGQDIILVVIDRYSKYAHFIALAHPFTASQIARVFMDTIYKLHGLPKSIVSDRDKVFLSNFWICFSSAYHPQTDG